MGVRSTSVKSTLGSRSSCGSRPFSEAITSALDLVRELDDHVRMAVMVGPPLTITRDELAEGVAVLDEVLAFADEYVS